MANLKVSKGAGASFSIGSSAGSFRTHGNPLPYIAPWFVAVAMLLLALPVRLVLARDSFDWFWSAASLVTYVLLTWGVHLASRARGTLTNWAATLGTGAAGACSWYIAGIPDLTWRPFAAYAMGTVLVCGVSNALSAFRQGGEGGPSMHDRLGKALAEVRNINAPRVANGTVVADIEAVPGSNVTELQRDVPAALESMHDLPEGSVRIVRGKPGQSTRVGVVRINPVDHLSSPPPYTGPSIRDGSGPFGFGTIMDPMTFGRRQGGDPLQLWLPGDARVHRNASLIQATGMSGAGKSEFIRYLLIESMSRGGPAVFEYWYLNSRKAAQEPDWVLRGAARVESAKKDIIRALKDLRDEIPGRSELLGKAGLEQWTPRAPVPLRLVVADEFADVAPDVERVLTDLSETLRSLGIILLCGFQRATGDRFPTSARSNFGTHVCFGVKDDVDAGMALPDEVLEAGASPWRWGNKQPGMCYLTAPGVAEDLWTEDARTWKPNRELQTRWAEHLIDLRAGNATQAPAAPAARRAQEAAVEPYVEEGELVDADYNEEDYGMDHAGVQLSDGQGGDDTIDLDQFDDAEAAAEAMEMVEDTLADDPGAEHDEDLVRPTIPADVADVHQVDHREPIAADGGSMRLKLQPKMSPTEAREFLRAHLLRLRDEGSTTVKVETFGEDVLYATGMSQSWLSKWLGNLAEDPDGIIRKLDDRGWYEFRAPAALPQA
jgi:hypothetical protein